MKLIKKKNKLIFEFEEDEKGIMVTTRVSGKLKMDHIVCAKQVIDNKIKELQKQCQKQKKVN